MRYRKKPVEVEAIQWDGINLSDIKDFVGESLICKIYDCAWEVNAAPVIAELQIRTLEGNMSVSKGDYIIKGIQGEFYPCKPDIFEQTYEPIF